MTVMTKVKGLAVAAGFAATLAGRQRDIRVS